MLHHLEYMINRFYMQPVALIEPGRAQYPVAIRRGRDSDLPVLQDLAALDSAAPLDGPVLVAVIEGRVWAAIGLDGERVIADPFLPTAAAVELLRLRLAQLRAAERPARRTLLPRWIARRAGA
jgi:hypothetical protein